jgi:hypothetical protein
MSVSWEHLTEGHTDDPKWKGSGLSVHGEAGEVATILLPILVLEFEP